jgi:large subunit ribosomal protein L15
MKLHDLRPAKGAHHPRKRVGRGIAAGGGKTAGRGTKGQKARAGASIPAWFEGGQTPLQMRIPKLHGFKNRFRIEYEVVNLGRITALVEAGVFEPGDQPGAKKAGRPERPALITINQEILRAAGLVSTLKKPLKVLGNGDLSTALFVVADSFSRSAIAKIEAAGGSVQVLEVPSEPLAALGLDLPELETSGGADASTASAVENHVEPKPAAKAEASPARTAAALAKPGTAKPGAARASAAKASAAKPKAVPSGVAKAVKAAKPTAAPDAAAKVVNHASRATGKAAVKPATRAKGKSSNTSDKDA